METLENLTEKPLEGILADFIQRELAVVGALHAALAVLRVVADLGALSGEELEALDEAAGTVLTLHGYALKRSEVRRNALEGLHRVMLLENGAVAELLPMPETMTGAEMAEIGFIPVNLNKENPQ